MRIMKRFPACILMLLSLALLAGCGGGGNNVSVEPVTETVQGPTAVTAATATPAVPTPTPGLKVTVLSVTPTAVSLAPGQTGQLVATATLEDGTTLDVSGSATWSSDNASVTVDARGLATAVASGTATVTATLQDHSATSTVTVVPVTNVILQQNLAPKVIPATVDTVRVTGRDENNNVLYGPVSQPVAVTNTFTGVPVTVVSITVEYLSEGVLTGTLVSPVTLLAGADFIINDPDYGDATPVAARLNFAPNLVGAAKNATFSTSVTVFDQFGNVLTGAANPITLSLLSGPTGATLAGTLTRTPVNGVATFDDLVLDVPGTGYQLLATSPALPNRSSAPFRVVDVPPGVTLGLQTLGNYLASFLVPGTDPETIPFPGFMHTWNIQRGFEIYDGFDGFFDVLTVGGISFPGNQTYGELTFLTPLFTAVDGLALTAVAGGEYRGPFTGNFSAFIGPTASSRISQTVNLTSSAAPITLSWVDDAYDDYGAVGIPVPAPPRSFRVVVRDVNGNELAELLNTIDDITTHTVDISQFAGQQVQVSFESTAMAWGNYVAEIDRVSVVDASATERITNGGFETGDFTGWTTTTVPQSQNVVSGTRTLAGLDVRRTICARPNEVWCRYVDSFTNNTGAPISTTVTYDGNLGSDGGSLPAFVPGSNNQAISSTDSSGNYSDKGFVFFAATTVTAPVGGSDLLKWSYDVTVNPGQTVNILQYVVQSGTHSASGTPTEMNAECLRILQNQGAVEFLDGLTLSQFDNFVNLP